MGSFKKGDRLKRNGLRKEKFPLPELGDGTYITLRAMSAMEMRERTDKENAIRKSVSAAALEGGEKLSDHEVNKRIAEHPDMQGYVLIGLCAIDDDGEPIFKDETDPATGKVKTAAQDAEESLDVGVYSVLAMVEKIMELSGMPISRDRSKN